MSLANANSSLVAAGPALGTVSAAGLRATLRQRASAFSPHASEDHGLRAAAVAIVVAVVHGVAVVLLTLRTNRLGRHAGQFALPGGKIDGGECACEAARRELHEELGLALPASARIGQLDDYHTQSGFCIRPLVYWQGELTRLSPSVDEVAAVYQIPLAELDSNGLPEPRSGEPYCSYLPSIGCQMYAPTAALLYQFREVLIRGRNTRLDDICEPRFAWR